LSTEHSVLRRNLIESDWFKGLWGDKVWLAEDQNQKTKYKNNSQAQMIATSVGGTATGLGGDTLILDDGMKPEEAPSEVIRATAHSWFDGTWSTRLNDPSTGAMIVVEQRTHELDISGALTDGWTPLVLPLEAETEERWVFPISGRVIERRPGDILQPERFPAAVVENLKKKRLVWAGQYQQHPSPLEGNMIKRSEVRYYGGRDPITGAVDPPLPDRFDNVLISVDCAFKDLKTSDFVCVLVAGTKGPNRYILNVVTKHLDVAGTEMETKRQRTIYGARTVLIEDKANGPAVIKNLRQVIPGVIEIEPEGGKVPRMFAACGEWQSGNWYVDRNAAWTDPFIEEITKFPTAKHDDQCDAMTQLSTWLQQNNQTYGLIEYMKQLDKEVMAKRLGKTKPATNGTKSNGSETKPLLPETVPPEPETGDLAHKTNVTAHTDEQIAVDIPDNVDRCPECKSVLVQRVAGGKRCGQCAFQWGQARILQPDPGQVRK
jgi:predicted phage terminase large subunit-like protein